MSGHGWVTPNENGTKARCGGPAICKECALEYAQKHLVPSTRDLMRRAETLLRECVAVDLTMCAGVGSWRLKVEKLP